MNGSQLKFEGMLFTGPADDTFAEFYRERIRFAEGARLSAKELSEAYVAWADERGACTSSARDIRAFMEANGHAHRKSSTVHYRDAVLGDFAGTPMPMRSIPVVDGRPMREAIRVAMDDLDALIGDMQAMRRRFERILAPAPTKRRGGIKSL